MSYHDDSHAAEYDTSEYDKSNAFHEKLEHVHPYDFMLNGGDSKVVGTASGMDEELEALRSKLRGNINDGPVKHGRIAGLERRMAELAAELEKLKRRPAEPIVDGNVITFEKEFVKGGKVYMYAAIKADGLWYTTGPKSPKAYTWDELLDFIGDDKPIYRVTQVVPLVSDR